MLQKIERSLIINFCSYTYQKTIVQGTQTVRMATLGLEAAPSSYVYGWHKKCLGLANGGEYSCCLS